MTQYYDKPKGMYRSRDGLLFGVCKGIAEYFDFSVGWTRMITVITFLLTGFAPIGIIYIILALMMKKEPIIY